MKRIPLTQGKFAIVDDENYEWLSQYKWRAYKNRNTYYAIRSINRKKNIYMHRQILSSKPGQITDHRNHNGLDNQESNIRICTYRQNQQNRNSHKNTSSKYKGVSWYKINKKWRAMIYFKRKNIHLGFFGSEVEAAKAYDTKAKELFGEFARLNLVLAAAVGPYRELYQVRWQYRAS